MSRVRTPLFVICGGLALAVALRALTGTDVAAQEQLQSGGELFQANCAACHGTDGTGMPGSGKTAGPPLRDVEIAYVDLVLRTGRMPIAARSIGVPEKRLNDDERRAVTAWMQRTMNLPGELPQLGRGDAGRGQQAFGANCAACHGADATGGITGDGNVAPPLHGLDPVALAEAARVGPFAMPRISEQVLDDEALADVAAYVERASDVPTTPIGLAEPGQVTLGLFAFAVLIGGLLAIAAAIRAVEGPGKRAEDD